MPYKYNFSWKKTLTVKLFLLILISVFLYRDFQVLAEESASDLNNKIDKLEDKVEDVKSELNTNMSLYQKKQSEVKTTKNLVVKTEAEMKRKEMEIDSLKKRITLNKEFLKEYLREAYFDDQEDVLVKMISESRDMGSLMADFDQMLNIKGKILKMLDEIYQNHNELEEKKNELEEKKEDHEQLLNVQKGQQVEIQSDIKEAQATLSELNAKINKLKGELSRLLGSAVSFKNVVDAAAFASKVTGVRKDYLLGVLVVESNLGRYTGGCNFKESRMSGTRAEIFKNICKELKYDYTKQKVSCPPSGYKGTGGAMGVAQFMPDTWQGYKSSIASVTGHNPPDPWNLTDGVVAMALKLAKVSGVTAHKKDAEAKAYCVYLAGNNWAAYCDSKGVNYGEKVLYWADNYEQKLK